MKTVILSLPLALLALVASIGSLASCKKPDAETAAEPEPQALPAAPPSYGNACASHADRRRHTAARSARAARDLLPQKASITTDDGIVGLKPGQGLRQIGPGTYEVNGQTVQLRNDQVTNNLRIARQYAAADAATQAALRQAMQPPPPRAPAPSTTTVSISATPTPRPISRPAAVPTTALSGRTKAGRRHRRG